MVAIVGPTGSGKSNLALFLAQRYDAEIVNFDSLQLYRFFNVGTAKVPESGRHGIPHHLLDIADPREVFTAGEYARRATAVTTEIAARGRLPLLVGGTGFYLRALLEGLAQAPARDPELRRRLEAAAVQRAGLLHRLLRRMDPLTAARIHANDTNKLIRAIEICILARQPASTLYKRGRTPFHPFIVLKLGLDPDRDQLKKKLDFRAEAMFRGGILDEIRSLLALGYTGDEKPFESLGYKQALAHLRGELTWEQAIEETKLRTRQYAKRQMTWFRRESGIQWLKGFGDEPEVQLSAADKVAFWLKHLPPLA
jgi:tRNA dimethylallyltransferase